jgi:PIN domain nuclease of toxin-antitoxin system
MRLLLDTHIWLWSVLEPERLSTRILQELTNPANEVWLSPISTWEVLLLSRRGRVQLDPNVSEWLVQNKRRHLGREAPITHEVALATADIQLAHRDLADHFLAATARVYDLTLVTADAQLLAGTGFQVMPNQ